MRNRAAITAAHVVVAVVAAASVVSGQTLPRQAVAAHTADSLARSFIASNGAPSLSISIIRGTDTILVDAWGMADREKNIPATPATVYRIGSVTKQFTSASVMQLVEQGKVKLDEPIGTYIKSLPEAWRPATVRQLLNHTSGVPSYTDIGARWASRWGDVMTPATIIALTAADPMWFAPGSNWKYDNTGYIVLGMLVERVSGVPWAEYVRVHLTEPLRLTDTQVCDNTQSGARVARGYVPNGSVWAGAAFLDISQPYAAGSLCSTTRDLSAWNRALGTGQVVTPASYALMTTPVGAAQSSNYGFGLMRQSIGTHTVITHGGAIPGFIAANAWVPDLAMTVTVLTNSGAARADPLLQQLVRAAIDAPPRVVLSAQERAQYVGVFALRLPAGTSDFTFTDRGGVLYAQLAGQGANAIIPWGNHAFGAAFDPSLRITFTVQNGRAVALELEQAGQRYNAVRKP